MFYFFHHIPKCGGTSFNHFLRSIFSLRQDYVGVNHITEPETFAAYKAAPLKLDGLTATDCVAGHYNLAGIRLPERYPELETLRHRKFSLLPEPYEAAQSGIRYGMAQGWLPEDMPKETRIARVMERANYFSRIFGISDASEIDALFKRYWFIAPLDRIDHAARILASHVSQPGKAIPHTNRTETTDADELPQWVCDDFQEKSALDYKLYERARLQFGLFSARQLLDKV